MVQLGEGEGFVAEALASILVAERAGRQNLEGDVAVQALIMGPEHQTHASGADLLENAVMAECFPNHREETLLGSAS